MKDIMNGVCILLLLVSTHHVLASPNAALREIMTSALTTLWTNNDKVSGLNIRECISSFVFGHYNCKAVCQGG